MTEHILVQLIVILCTVCALGFLCRRLGQPWVIAEILAGMILGPSLVGALWPHLEQAVFPSSTMPTLQTLGDIGLVLYMFSLGTHFDVQELRSHGRTALLVTSSGVLVPFLLGATFALSLYPRFAGPHITRLSFVLVVGTTLAITAFPVLARLLAEKNMLRSPIGMLALTCAALGDALAWGLLALAIAVAHAQSVTSAGLILALTILFVLVMCVVVRPVLAYVTRQISSAQVLVSLALVLLLLSAWVTTAMGVHPAFGAFLMGVILPRSPLYGSYVRSLDQVNNGLFLPLFFVSSGLLTQVGLLGTPTLWALTLSVVVLACLGKILGTTLSLRWTGAPWRDAFCLGALMNMRGGVALIVLNIALGLHIFTSVLFAMLVIMTLVTTMMAAPLLVLAGYRTPEQPETRTGLDATEQALTVAFAVQPGGTEP